MVNLPLLGLILIFTCVAGFVFFFGDKKDPGIGGQLTRLVLDHVPGLIASVSKRVLGERVHGWLADAFDWCIYRRNPLLQLAYGALVIGGYAVIVWQAYPMIPNLYMAGYHRYTGFVVWFFTLWTLDIFQTHAAINNKNTCSPFR